MKAIFEKTALINAVTPGLGCVSSKNTYTALEGILLDCANGKCVITSYDLEKGYRTEITAETEEDGKYIINAQKLCQIVKTMPGSFVTVEINNKNVVRIYSGKSEFELHAISGEDFPSLPDLDGNEGFTIAQSVFRKMLTRIQFAVAQNSMRPELNGAYFKIEDNKITAVSCDGSRLALCEQTCDLKNAAFDEEVTEFIIPGKTLTEISKLVSDSDDEMTIKLARKHVIFFVGDKIFFSRLIENEYIDYERFIPKTSRIFVNVDRDSLLEAMERALLVAEDKSMGQLRSKLKCSFTGNLLTLSSKSLSNKITDEVFVSKDGEDIEIGFNCRFLTDAVRACDFDKIKLSLTSPLMSMLIEPEVLDSDDRFVFLVLPLKLND